MSIAEKLTQIAENQQRVYDAGFVAGQAQGGGDDDGSYDEGYEQGKTDAIENLPNGYLKVDPSWTSFNYLCQNRSSIVANLKYSDTANGTSFISTFQYSNVTSIPSLDLRKGTNFNGMFAYASSIQEIGEMDISSATIVSNMFLSCSGLIKVSFTRGCIKLSISFAQSGRLDDASIQSIMDGLADLTGQTAQTLTLHATVGAKLTDAQKATATAKNWTLAY